MHNLKYRGPNFKWEDFPDMLSRHCKTMLFASVDIPENKKREYEQHAAETGRQIGEQMVKNMTEEPE